MLSVLLLSTSPLAAALPPCHCSCGCYCCWLVVVVVVAVVVTIVVVSSSRFSLACRVMQVLATAGVGIIFYQFFVYPRLVPVVGLVRLQRVGLIVTIVGVFALPNLTYLPWNYGALYALSAIILTLLLCGYSMVSGSTIPSRNLSKSTVPLGLASIIFI